MDSGQDVSCPGLDLGQPKCHKKYSTLEHSVAHDPTEVTDRALLELGSLIWPEDCSLGKMVRYPREKPPFTVIPDRPF